MAKPKIRVDLQSFKFFLTELQQGKPLLYRNFIKKNHKELYNWATGQEEHCIPLS
jgi:hypothetical protein